VVRRQQALGRTKIVRVDALTTPSIDSDLATLRDLLGQSDTGVASKYLGASPQRAEAAAAPANLPDPKELGRCSGAKVFPVKESWTMSSVS
jgi:hypothetical protein